MDTINSRFSVVLISGIMVVVATALFFIVPITLTFIIAYIFTLIAIALFCVGSLYMLANSRSYPWFAAFPMTIWRYLITQISLSAVFVLRASIFPISFPIGLFVFLHIATLGFFAVKLILIKSGKDIIEESGAQVDAKVLTLRMMQADVESLARQHPEYEKPLRQVAETLKYSDPMSHASLWVYDEQIRKNISAMSDLKGDDVAKISSICDTLLNQIADRNSRVKLLK